MDLSARKNAFVEWLMTLQDTAVMDQLEEIRWTMAHNAEDMTLSGPPMTVDELKNRIRSAKTRVAAGEYITQEEIEAETESW